MSEGGEGEGGIGAGGEKEGARRMGIAGWVSGGGGCCGPSVRSFVLARGICICNVVCRSLDLRGLSPSDLRGNYQVFVFRN